MIAASVGIRRGNKIGWPLALASAIAAMSLVFSTGCASGPAATSKAEELGLAVAPEFDGTVQMIEYAGSDIGDPIPWWIQVPIPDVEGTDEFRSDYVFLHSIAEPSFEAIHERLATYPVSSRTAIAIHDRAYGKLVASGGDAGAGAGLVEEAAQLVLAFEYAGFRRRGDFWVHELLFDEEGKQVGERFRGWILSSVPRDQVHAGLRLAYQNADAHHPAENDAQTRTREQLLAVFRNGL